MRILAIRDALVPIGAPMRNASIGFDQMTASAVAVHTDHLIAGQAVIGYAFDSIGRYGKSGLLRERFIPRLLAAAVEALQDESGLIDPERAWNVMMANEKEGGHGERAGAVGILDAALWDARAKAAGVPLWRCLADRYGGASAIARIAVYGSCGHFRPGESLAGLADEVARAGELGYRTVKIKVGGANVDEDLARVAVAAAALRRYGSNTRIAVDANGRLAVSVAPQWLSALGDAGVAWIEEPASALDFNALAEHASATTAPIATGENLFSFDEARNLLRYGGLRAERDLLQFDILLAYGVPEYVRILKLFEQASWLRRQFYPHAGHLFAAHCVAGLGLGSAEAAPDATLSYGGCWDGCAVAEGALVIPDYPGVGYEAKANLMTVLAPLGTI